MRQWQNHRTYGNTVEPPVSHHPKCKDLVVAYGKRSLTGGGRLQESNNRASFPKSGPGTSTLWKIIYCRQFRSYAMCSSMLLLSSSYTWYIPSSIVHIPNIYRDQRMRQVVAYNRLKRMENH